MSLSDFSFKFYSKSMPTTCQCNYLGNSMALGVHHERTMTSTPLKKPPQQKQTQQLRSQLHSTQKHWCCENRQVVQEMDNCSSGFIEPVSKSRPCNNYQQQGMDFWQNDAKAANSTFVVSNSKNYTTFSASNVELEEATNGPQSVRDKVGFFNKLTTTFEPKIKHVNSKFLAMLKTTKNFAAATVVKPIAATLTLAAHPANQPKKSHFYASTPLEIERDRASSLHSNALTAPEQQQYSHSKGGAVLATFRRKTAFRRKPSMEKSRSIISRQNAGSSNNSNPQMYAMMNDLSMVKPVRIRVAEYERRIQAEA